MAEWQRTEPCSEAHGPRTAGSRLGSGTSSAVAFPGLKCTQAKNTEQHWEQRGCHHLLYFPLRIICCHHFLDILNLFSDLFS